MEHIQGWCIGIAASLLGPLVISWLAGKGVKSLVAWQISKTKALLEADTGDKALDAFEHDLVLALAKLAKAKFPESGLGVERKKMVVDFLTSKIPLFRGQEVRLSALIDAIVAGEKEVLDSIQ